MIIVYLARHKLNSICVCKLISNYIAILINKYIYSTGIHGFEKIKKSRVNIHIFAIYDILIIYLYIIY